MDTGAAWSSQSIHGWTHTHCENSIIYQAAKPLLRLPPPFCRFRPFSAPGKLVAGLSRYVRALAWPQDYKEWLESMMKSDVKDEVPLVADYSEHHSDADVHFRWGARWKRFARSLTRLIPAAGSM